MNDKKVSRQAIEIAIRLVLLFGLIYWCFQILSPFIMPLLWAAIIAIAVWPIHDILVTRLRFKPVLSSVVLTLIMLLLVIGPSVAFFGSATDAIYGLKNSLETDTFTVPAPPDFIENMPVVGEKLHDFLSDFNNNVKNFVLEHQEKFTELTKGVLKTILGTGLGVLQLILSIIIAGVLLVVGGNEETIKVVLGKITGEDGSQYIKLTLQTVRSVVKGVLGVAVIQTILAGIGLFSAGIPHAALWTVICLVLSIIQVGPTLVLIGASIYLFNAESTLFASLWAGYFVLVALSDNVLKPILLGKGAPVPMLVIFLGVIGGFMLSGFIGLFTGAITLSLLYKLFNYWIEQDHNNSGVMSD